MRPPQLGASAVVARPDGGVRGNGTWREALGPALGDSLAVARTTLQFARKR